MKGGRRQGSEGFALIEAIAVLALSILILLTLVIATGLVTRNSAAASRRSNDLEAVVAGFAALRRDVEAAQFARGAGGADAPVLFAGTDAALGFALGDGGSERGNGSLIRIEARYENGRGVLVRSAAPLTPQLAGFADAGFGDPVALLSGPWRYRFSYAAPGDGAAVWTSGWSSAAALPRAVRLELIDPAGASLLPPLVIRLWVDAENACAPGPETDCAEPAGAEPTGEEEPGGGVKVEL